MNASKILKNLVPDFNILFIELAKTAVGVISACLEVFADLCNAAITGLKEIDWKELFELWNAVRKYDRK